MNEHRSAVAIGLNNKIRELRYFALNIKNLAEVIENKHKTKDYPIVSEVDELNYSFSAFLNSIQSIKDSSQTSMDINISWQELSPSYGQFIFYCRNASTHDGTLLINASSGFKSYIVGPLRRTNDRGAVIEFDPPREDIFSLCSNITLELVGSLTNALNDYGDKIPLINEESLRRNMEVALASNFISDHFKDIIREHQEETIRQMLTSNPNFVDDIAKSLSTLASDVYLS